MEVFPDISSEDSNIQTFFKTFESESFIISPSNDLSQTLAKIELVIQDLLNDENNLESTINQLYNLMINLIQIVELHLKLYKDFKEFFDSRLDFIVRHIFTTDLFTQLYYLKNDGIDLVWQLHRLIDLIYGFRYIDDKPFKLVSSTNISVIKCFQYPLFKYLRSPNDKAQFLSPRFNKPQPCEAFRGEIKVTFIILEKLKLMEDSLVFVLSSCTLDKELISHFESLLNDSPTYFSFDMFYKHIKVFDDRLKQEDDMEIKLMVLRLKKENTPELFQSNITDKRLNWVKYMGFDENLQFQNSDIVPSLFRKSEVPPSPNSLVIHRENSETSILSLPVYRQGFRDKFSRFLRLK